LLQVVVHLPLTRLEPVKTCIDFNSRGSSVITALKEARSNKGGDYEIAIRIFQFVVDF
jgi:hypothetical protein